MTNENYLEGVKCPACGNEDTFRIAVKTMATVTDDGAEVEHGDMDWDEASYAECADCYKFGKLSDFKAQSEIPPGSSPPPPTLLAALSNLLGETDYDGAGICIGCGRARGDGEHKHCAGYWGEIEFDCPRAYARAAIDNATTPSTSAPTLFDALLDIKHLASKHDDNGYEPYAVLELIEQEAIAALAQGRRPA